MNASAQESLVRGGEESPRAAGPGDVPLLVMSDIHKSYSGVTALRGVHFSIGCPGEVHGLMGENGCGKSSLLKILAGRTTPDRGEVVLRGERVAFRNPWDALQAGIAMVAQETAVAPQLTVAENILLGRRLVRTARGIDWRRTNERAAEILDRLGLAYDPRRLVDSLRPDERQMVEIARALSCDAKLVILDEPTSSLTDDEVEHLFAAVAELKRQGVAVVLVSHRLSEVFGNSDRLTVLRDGRTVATGAVTEFDVQSLVTAMVGETSAERARATVRPRPKAPVLTVERLTVPGAVADASLEVRRGEILGIAGLVGAGRSELLAGIFAPPAGTSGTVRVGDRQLAARTVRASIDAGIGYVPPDRANGGLLLGLSVRENMTVVRNSAQPRWRRPRRSSETAAIAEPIRRMRIRAKEPEQVVGTLSGGNQQKVAVARWLATDLSVLLLDEPTRGVDVNAKREIHDLLRECSADGLGLLVSSSEYDELLDLCDRILVMFRGRIVADLPRAEANEKTLSSLAGGHE